MFICDRPEQISEYDRIFGNRDVGQTLVGKAGLADGRVIMAQIVRSTV